MSIEKPSVQVNGQSSVYNEKGQTVIPKDVRRAAGLQVGDKIDFIYEDGIIYIIPSEELVEERGE